MKKVVLVIDAYKGCLSSREVEQAAEEGIRMSGEEVEVVSLPIADGGEGMLEVLVNQTGGQLVHVESHDALMRPINADFGVLGDGRTAVVEMAQASGLPLLSIAERNPMVTTSYGTGELVKAAIDAGFRQIVMGIGGSATNDGGIGMMQALGARFYSEAGTELSTGCGEILGQVAAVDLTDFQTTIKGTAFVTACDVRNPLCGPEGAAYVYAPQKGATPEMVRILDLGMSHYAQLMNRYAGSPVEQLPGAGAAGGMGACLHVFFNSPLKSGIRLLLEQLNFREYLRDASLVLTGEGKADRQTLMGKVPAGVLEVAKEYGKNVILVAGKIEDAELLRLAGFKQVVAVTPEDMPLEKALLPEIARENIKRTVQQILPALKN